MQHMIVIYEVAEDTDISEMLPRFPRAKSIHLNPGLKLTHKHTGETAILPYGRWFDENSGSWNPSPYEEYNWVFLRQQQNWANDLLCARGYLFLNEVQGMLGIGHTQMGAVVGWVYDRDVRIKPDKHPSFVDFGCWEQEGKDFPDKPGAILLDFNVQGPILHIVGQTNSVEKPI